jgi:hypothetical protein
MELERQRGLRATRESEPLSTAATRFEKIRRSCARLFSRRLWDFFRRSIGYNLTALSLVPLFSLLFVVGVSGASDAGAQYLLVPIFLLSVTAHRVGKRFVMPRAKELERTDCRSRVLYLRSFGDDFLSVRTMSWVWRILFFRCFSWHFTTFEELLVYVFATCGPVVAIGSPDEKLPPIGAAREWVTDSEWQHRVVELMAECRLLVLNVGDLGNRSGLRWEVERILTRCDLKKVVFVLPPLRHAYARNAGSNLLPLLASDYPLAKATNWRRRSTRKQGL